jgi:acyl-homoserine lactone acylase PvdQ
VTRLTATQGADPTRWRWGAVHRVWLGTPFGLVPGIGRPFVALDGEFPGDEYTVNPSRAIPWRGRLYAFVGATSRFICDLSRPDEALWAHSAGPSADPRTTYFASLSAAWHRSVFPARRLARRQIPDPVDRLRWSARPRRPSRAGRRPPRVLLPQPLARGEIARAAEFRQ